MTAQTITNFWFNEIDSSKWWAKDVQFDELIHQRFGHLHKQAICCELSSWRNSAVGSLAEIIILDQFSRNMFRDTPLAFAYDSLALVLAQTAIAKQQDLQLPLEQRVFMYMPFMHSESKVIHRHAVTLFTELGIESNLDFELKHKAIIDRFGRYPYRNTVLDRESTAEEIIFLQQPSSGF